MYKRQINKFSYCTLYSEELVLFHELVSSRLIFGNKYWAGTSIRKRKILQEDSVGIPEDDGSDGGMKSQQKYVNLVL